MSQWLDLGGWPIPWESGLYGKRTGMRHLNEKVVMMVRGLVIGSSMSAVLTILVMGGRPGIWGFISVLSLTVLTGLGGRLIRFRTRTHPDADRMWLKGYKEGH